MKDYKEISTIYKVKGMTGKLKDRVYLSILHKPARSCLSCKL